MLFFHLVCCFRVAYFSRNISLGENLIPEDFILLAISLSSLIVLSDYFAVLNVKCFTSIFFIMSFIIFLKRYIYYYDIMRVFIVIEHKIKSKSRLSFFNDTFPKFIFHQFFYGNDIFFGKGSCSM